MSAEGSTGVHQILPRHGAVSHPVSQGCLGASPSRTNHTMSHAELPYHPYPCRCPLPSRQEPGLMLWGSFIAPYMKAVLKHPRGDASRFGLAITANLPRWFVCSSYCIDGKSRDTRTLTQPIPTRTLGKIFPTIQML